MQMLIKCKKIDVLVKRDSENHFVIDVFSTFFMFFTPFFFLGLFFVNIFNQSGKILDFEIGLYKK